MKVSGGVKNVNYPLIAGCNNACDATLVLGEDRWSFPGAAEADPH